MNILCDTCSILMLIRIAPDMFIDERYSCFLLPSVAQELLRTAKFEKNYPWRKAFREKLKPIPASKMEEANYVGYRSTAAALHNAGVLDQPSEKLFVLSRVDLDILAFALAQGMRILTGDKGIVRFARQEFAQDFAGEATPLGLINDWLERGLITWDETRQTVLEEWAMTGEAPQPKDEIKRFTKFTKERYPGP